MTLKDVKSPQETNQGMQTQLNWNSLQLPTSSSPQGSTCFICSAVWRQVLVAELTEGFPAAFLPLKSCSWDTEFAIPENVGLLLYQGRGKRQKGQEQQRGLRWRWMSAGRDCVVRLVVVTSDWT